MENKIYVNKRQFIRDEVLNIFIPNRSNNSKQHSKSRKLYFIDNPVHYREAKNKRLVDELCKFPKIPSPNLYLVLHYTI